MHNKSKGYTTLIVAVLMLLPLLTIMPVSATITGTETLRRVIAHTVNDDGSLSVALTGAFDNSSVIQTEINSTVSGNLVAIDITGMTITGAQVWLYLSETGGAVIETGDIWYAGPFTKTAIVTVDVNATNQNFAAVTDGKTGQTFWVGNNMIIGPMPAGPVVPKGVKYYVKMIDVSPTTPTIPSSDVAVSSNQWKPYETIKISPTSGPVGTVVTVKGMAWDSSKLVNVSYANSAVALIPVEVALFTPSTNGTFTKTFAIPDPKNAAIFNTNVTMYVNAYYNGSASVTAYKSFTENERKWLQVSTATSGAGNNYAGGDVKVLSTIYISAEFVNPGSTVALYWDFDTSSPVTLKSSVTVNSVTGFYNVSVTVPVTKMGTHKITSVDKTYNINATVNVIPTLVLNPTSGPIGTTVAANGYGFPYAGANNVTLQWDYTDYDAKAVVDLVYKVYTGSNGQFSTSFTVPSSVGGDHDVGAYTNETIPTIANATFTVTALLTITPASPTNNGTEVTITGTGLAYPAYYDLCIDYSKDFGSNDSIYPIYFMSSSKGELSAFKIVIASGFNAGKHVIALYKMQTGTAAKLPTLDAYKVFTVVGEAETAIMDELTKIETAVDSLKAYVNSTSTGLPALKTLLTTVQTAVSDARSALATQITGLSTELTTIETYAQTAATQAATAATSASSAATAASGAKTSADSAASATSTISTAVYGAIVLSLIAALASIVAVITLQRKVA